LEQGIFELTSNAFVRIEPRVRGQGGKLVKSERGPTAGRVKVASPGGARGSGLSGDREVFLGRDKTPTPNPHPKTPHPPKSAGPDHVIKVNAWKK